MGKNEILNKRGDVVKMLELLLSYMKFTTECCSNEDTLSNIKLLLADSLKKLGNNKKLSREGFKLLNLLLSASVDVTLISSTLRNCHSKCCK